MWSKKYEEDKKQIYIIFMKDAEILFKNKPEIYQNCYRTKQEKNMSIRLFCSLPLNEKKINTNLPFSSLSPLNRTSLKNRKILKKIKDINDIKSLTNTNERTASIGKRMPIPSSDTTSNHIAKQKHTEDIAKKGYNNQKTDILSLKKKKKTTKEYNSKKNKIKGVLGKIHISTTKNNSILSLIDHKGYIKGWSCSGSLGFKNARKSTTYAAQAAAESIVKKAKILGYTHLRLLARGLGRGKQSCLRTLTKSGLKIISVEDKTAIPHNGCRPSKKRRV